MQHTLTCDKCGEKFETYCFGGGSGETFFSPPMPKDIYQASEFEEFVADMSTRSVLAFCTKHAEEYRATL